MLRATNIVGFGGGGVNLPRLDYLQSAGDATNGTSFSFTSQGIGVPSPSRHIIVLIHAVVSNTISSVTIAGQSATIVASAQGLNASYASRTGIAIASIPTGESGTVAVTFGSSAASCVIDVYAAYYLDSATANDTATDGDTVGTNKGDLTVQVDVPQDGIIIAGTTDGVSGAFSVTWTGVTERVDTYLEGGSVDLGYSSASLSGATAEINRSVTVSAAAGAAQSIAAATWR